MLDREPLFATLALPRPLLEEVCFLILRENAGAGFPEITQAVAGLAELLRERGPNLSRDAHAKSLMTSLVPDARRSFLASLDWRIKEVASPSFVLPDFVALALDHAGTPSSLVAADNDDLAAVLMPLSSTRMLIGQVTPEPVDLSTFNAQAAPHFFAFFVSAFASGELEQLAIRIGISATERVEQALHQAVSKLRPTPDAPTTLAPHAGEGIGWQAAQPCSFELHVDCLSEPDVVCGPGMRWRGSILKADGSATQASQLAWKGVRHRSALRCLAKL